MCYHNLLLFNFLHLYFSFSSRMILCQVQKLQAYSELFISGVKDLKFKCNTSHLSGYVIQDGIPSLLIHYRPQSGFSFVKTTAFSSIYMLFLPDSFQHPSLYL